MRHNNDSGVVTMPLQTKPFDAADYVTSPEIIIRYLNEVIARGDAAAVQHTLGAVARARGMTTVARASGLSRENLYRSLSASQNASFGIVLRIVHTLGYELQFKPKRARAAPITFLAADRGKRKVGSSRAKKAVAR
jgi:probable addiction module antidote protein